VLWSELKKRLTDSYQLMRDLYQVFPRGYCLEARGYRKISAPSMNKPGRSGVVTRSPLGWVASCRAGRAGWTWLVV